MAQTEIVRFVHGGGTTSFYNDEIQAVHLDTVQGIDLFNDASGYFHLYKVGEEYYRVRITFLIVRSSVLDRIEDVWDRVDSYKQPEAMELFYKYKLSTSTSIWVQMKRDDMIWPYAESLVEYRRINLTFIEAVPAGVTIHRKRISV